MGRLLSLAERLNSLFRQNHIFFAAMVAVALAVIAVALSLDRRHQVQYQQELHEQTQRAAAAISRRLSSRIQIDLASAQRLSQIASHQPAGFQALLHRVVEQELAKHSHVIGLGLAPDFRLERVFSRASSPAIQADAARSRDRLTALLDGPLSKRKPMMVSFPGKAFLALIRPNDGEFDVREAPGAAVVLIDKQQLMREAGVAPSAALEAQMPSLDWLDVAVVDLGQTQDQLFFGDPSILEKRPLSWNMTVVDTTWQILAVPKSGWDVAAPDQLEYRFSLALGGLALIVPVVMASLLIGERNRNITALKAREANLLELSQRFNLAMEASNIGIWEVTRDGQHLFWDERAAAVHGQPASGLDNRLEDWLEVIHPQDRPAAEAHFFTCTCVRHACSETYRVLLPDGTERHVRSAGASYRNPDGSMRTAGIVWDVTADEMMTQTLRQAKQVSDIKNAELELALDELSRREQELEELSNKLDLALASYSCGIWEYDPFTNVERWDERMCQLYGIPYTDGIISKSQWFALIHPDDRAQAEDVSARFLSRDIQDALVVRVAKPDGGIRYIRSVGQLQMDRNGNRKIIGIAFDVTEDALLTAELKAAKAESDAKNAELEVAKSRIEHNALHDPLTSLANRRKLDMELDRISRDSREERQKFTILHLDLDRFKQINDTLGHAAGDAMLTHASEVLSRNVRGSDLVARIGGDEFVILARGSSGSDEMAQLAGRIIAELHQPIDFDGFECRCGVSIGIAVAGGLNIDARRILVNADIALYRAKAMGRNRYEFFTQNLQAEIISHKRTADEVLAGIDNDEFVTWYQPQFNAQTNELTGVEALVRWRHPHFGILAPDRFLKIAEDLNVAATLDHIVLQTVLKDKMRWTAMGLQVPKVSVNVSSRRLHDEGLVGTLRSLSIRPGEISFELVESIFLDEHEDIAATNLDQIKALGIDIEIDDFGTGHTSIVSLLKLKPKRLKIDRQLVMPILNSPQERALVRSIIDIARSLGVETVAEGVETMQHAALLRDLGCDLLQGYAFARPLGFEDFTQMALANWARAAA
ncbi:diguanylate cyclase (GGDEF)-like protein/PAS domain S-box-containing protein [Pseudorhizobium tarimense]|uniref:Diguanylate cyclase (GGDEF)-like protein/PAS domain S-box-containing protein n=1 Tax=Pseudorhizobium tarimense TaxID=1079109 RepID=A0ABV2H1G2_9HYPH|nr:EAL domain-containing protein [Pseudorhizobium tarimense]MCJ8517547.1 EAL domain-containing protein [Pseudorhizobium tarimense]